MAFPVTLNGRTYTLTDFEGTNYVDGLPDAFEDFVTHAGDIYNSTSTTSNSIGTGSKTFTVEANKPYQAGTPLRIADAAAPSTNFLDTVVTSYSGTTLVVNSIGYGGSGTKTSWTVNIGGAKTIDGTLGVSQGGTGATTAAAARTNLDTYSKTEADSRFLNVSGEASNVTMNGDVTIGDASSDTLTVNATADFNTGFNVDGTVTSDGLTVAGNLSVDGGTIKLDGNYPNGTSNAALGNQALANAGVGNYNVAIGDSALFANTSSSNTAVGSSALASNTGANNVAVGRQSLASNTTAGGNTALGYRSLFSNTAGESVAVGYLALEDATTGGNNVAVGSRAGRNVTSATRTVAIGRDALVNLTTGSSNVAVGMEALSSIDTYSSNVAVGYRALRDVTREENVAIGADAMIVSTTASQSVAIGYGAMYNNDTADGNTAVGYQSMYYNVSGGGNAAVGWRSLHNNTGTNNAAFGYQAAFGNTSASSNTAMGANALYSNQTGGGNTGVGRNALNVNVSDYNTALGGYALRANTSGNRNTALGYAAMYDTTSGQLNTAVGVETMENVTTSNDNTGVGFQALRTLNSGTGRNTAVGIYAGYSLASGFENVFMGRSAGYNATGDRNTFLGGEAGSQITSGEKNTIIGRYNGNQGGLDIRTLSNNIVLSDGDGNPRLYINSNGYTRFGTFSSTGGSIGVEELASGTTNVMRRSSTNVTALNYHLNFHNPNGSVGTIGTQGSSTIYATSSDYRLKENVVELTGATDRLKQLNPSRFNFIADADTIVDGFIAHEVQSVVPEAITGTHNEVDADGNPVYQGIDQSKLVPLLVATIKELEARITALENA